MHGLSFNEIAKLLNKPIGTVKWKYYNSIKVIKLILTNLTLSIITFAIGIKVLLKKQIKEEQKQEENTVKEEQNTSYDNDRIEDTQKKQDNTTSNEIKSEVIIPNIKPEEKTLSNNYIGIGILSFSALFLITTIILYIFLKKHQPK